MRIGDQITSPSGEIATIVGFKIVGIEPVTFLAMWQTETGHTGEITVVPGSMSAASSPSASPIPKKGRPSE